MLNFLSFCPGMTLILAIVSFSASALLLLLEVMMNGEGWR